MNLLVAKTNVLCSRHWVSLGSYVWLQVSIEMPSTLFIQCKPPPKIHIRTHTNMESQGICFLNVKWKLRESQWEWESFVRHEYLCIFDIPLFWCFETKRIGKREKIYSVYLRFNIKTENDIYSIWNACKFVRQSHKHHEERWKLDVQIQFKPKFFLLFAIKRLIRLDFDSMNPMNWVVRSLGLFIWLISKSNTKSIDAWFTFK